MIDEILKRWGIQINPDEILENPDPYSYFRDFHDVNKAITDIELKLSSLKLKEKELTAQLYLSVKNNGEKVTEKQIESMINTSIEVIELRTQINELQCIFNFLDRFLETLNERSMSMNSLLADRRKGLVEP